MTTAHHHERRLGCDIALTVVAADPVRTGAALAAGRTCLDGLDHRWSRFRPDSELCRLNAAGGAGPQVVSVETLELVAAAVEVWLATGGLVDASVLDVLEHLGYDRSFDLLVPAVSLPSELVPVMEIAPTGPTPARAAGSRTSGAAGPVPGLGGVQIDRVGHTVALPTGVRIDPGGLGKGLIADATADAIMAAGASGCCVDLGGDVAVRGTTDLGHGWIITVEDPFDERDTLAWLSLAEGAVATSGVRRRRWSTADGTAHHLIDPRTGRPTTGDVVAATVVAADAMWAEVLAKAVVISGLVEGVALLAASGASGLLVTADRLTVRTSGLDRFEVPGDAADNDRFDDDRTSDDRAGAPRRTGGGR